MSSELQNKEVIHRVLEETRDFYKQICVAGHPNADYAEFASQQALADFRRAFGDPELTHDQLCRLLRSAVHKEHRRQCKTPWALFMANYIERNDNTGGRAMR